MGLPDRPIHEMYSKTTSGRYSSKKANFERSFSRMEKRVKEKIKEEKVEWKEISF